MPDQRVVYSSELDPKQVLSSLEAIQRKIEDLEKAGDRSFKKVGDDADKAADRSSRAFAKMGSRAEKALGAILAIAAGLQQAFELANEAVSGVRIERSFFRLAATAGQSGDAILEAMTRASNGTIDRITLMTKANQALQLRVAKTPEEFAKLTRSAIALGQAVGENATQALDDLINAAGRRSTEVLDNLGISLSSVNERMEQLAQQQFGQAVTQLDQAQRNSLFMAAALDVAAKQADKLGGATQDVGTGIEQQAAQAKNFKQELGELATIGLSVGDSFIRWLSGGTGLLEGLINGTKAWQNILIQTVAIIDGLRAGAVQAFENIARPLEQIGQNIRQFFFGLQTGDFSGFQSIDFSAFSNIGDDVGDAISQQLNFRLDQLNERFKEIIDPEAAAQAADQAADVGSDIGDAFNDALEAQADIREKIAEETAASILRQEEKLADARRRLANRQTEDAIRNSEKRADIIQRNLDRIADIERKNQQRFDDIIAEAGNDENEARADARRRQAELDRDIANERIQIDRQAAQRRLDIERDFRREIERIQTTFRQSELAAEAANNVQAFVQAVRRRDADLEEAKKSRDEGFADVDTERKRQIEEAKQAAKEQREALREQLTQELDDVRAANEEKLAVLATRLERELQEEDIRFQRAKEQQDVAEQRQRDARQRAFQNELDAFAQKEQARIDRLRASLDEELELVKAAEREKAKVRIDEARKAIEAVRKINKALGASFGGRGSRLSSSSSLPIPSLPVILKGAPTASNRIPTPEVFNPPVTPASIGGPVDNSRSVGSQSFHLSQSMLDDPIERARLQSFVNRAVGDALGG